MSYQEDMALQNEEDNPGLEIDSSEELEYDPELDNIDENEDVSLDLTAKHPEIIVQLTGEDGNAFAILGRVRQAMRRGKVSEKEIQAFQDEATSGDYNNVLATCMRWVTVR